MHDLVVRLATKPPQDPGFMVEAMSNLRPSGTGVDGAVVWISAGEFGGGDPLPGPRILVVLGDKITTLRHWGGEIGAAKTIALLRKV